MQECYQIGSDFVKASDRDDVVFVSRITEESEAFDSWFSCKFDLKSFVEDGQHRSNYISWKLFMGNFDNFCHGYDATVFHILVNGWIL